jgi:hypothetical protein
VGKEKYPKESPALRVLIPSFFRNVSSIRATHIRVQCALKSASLPILMLTFL